LIPLSHKNFWIYEDSVFANGIFHHVQFDTLRYNKTYQSLADNLIWWESNISVGIPQKLFSNDSALFQMQDRFFTEAVIDARKDFALFTGDSIRYLASFEDNAAQGRSLKMESTFATPAGYFEGWILFEKYARNFRRDQVFFKPGLGVMKYTREKAPMGSRTLKPEQILTLVSYHIE
jgi:hypothetical protein